MKTLRLAVILILTTLLVPVSGYPAELADGGEILGVIVEKSETGEFIQVDDYVIGSVETIVIRDGDKADQDGSIKDLFVGALVSADLIKQADEGHGYWSASEIVLLLGAAQEKALANASEAEVDRLSLTQENLSESEVVAQEQTEAPAEKDTVEAQPPEPAKEDNLRLEDGVWVN